MNKDIIELVLPLAEGVPGTILCLKDCYYARGLDEFNTLCNNLIEIKRTYKSDDGCTFSSSFIYKNWTDVDRNVDLFYAKINDIKNKRLDN
jgi:hypothetical protein